MFRTTLLTATLTALLALPNLALAVPFWSTGGNLRYTDSRDAQGKHFHEHAVNLQAGQRYVFEMNSQHFDTYLKLHAPNGAIVAVNDDSGPALNARIVYVAPVSGLYRLHATSFRPGATGFYRVAAERIGGFPNPGNPNPGNPSALVLNIHGNLNYNDPFVNSRHQKTYAVTLHAGRRYSIDMTSSHFDTYLKLAVNGQVIRVNDDSGPGLNARLVFIPNVTRVYQVLATSYAPNATGHFHLTVREQ